MKQLHIQFGHSRARAITSQTQNECTRAHTTIETMQTTKRKQTNDKLEKSEKNWVDNIDVVIRQLNATINIFCLFFSFLLLLFSLFGCISWIAIESQNDITNAELRHLSVSTTSGTRKTRWESETNENVLSIRMSGASRDTISTIKAWPNEGYKMPWDWHPFEHGHD